MTFSVQGSAQGLVTTDLGVLLILLSMAALLNPQRGWDRVVMACVTGFLILAYVAWRTSATLPTLEMTAASVWAYAFYAFEMLAITYSLASMVILCRVVDRTDQVEAGERLLENARSLPAVDVFICTYNEPLNVLEKSIVSALALDYPNIEIFVCDDTRRAEVREYCSAVGVNYITRPDNRHAKAGNLNNALLKSAEGRQAAPLILVLDADFAPQHNLLRRAVGLFIDRKVGVVQTPQFYYNCDPIQHNLGLRHSFVDDQRVFFDVFQPSKDAVDCAFCVGTSFIVRRDLVVKLGGFPHEALSEDMLLTYRLMQQGYVTRWLNERLSVGLSAEGLGEYVTQRTRWCLGTIQIGLLADGPLFGGGFSVTQRLHYLHGLLSWLSKPFIVLMMVAPLLYWFFGLPAFYADFLAFMRFGVPALLAYWIYSTWVSEARTLPLFTEVTHALVALPVTATLLGAMRNPFGKPFKVTEKGGDRSQVTVRVGMAAMFGVVTLALATAIALATVGPGAQTNIADRDLFNLVWAGVAMVTALTAMLVCFERPRESAEERIFLANGYPTVMRTSGGEEALIIQQLSAEEVVLSSSTRLPPEGDMEIFLPEAEWVPCKMHPSEPGVLMLQTTLSQRCGLTRFLFSRAPENVAARGNIVSALASLMARAFVQ
jgi:cellulose synthase (UDP-forming)